MQDKQIYEYAVIRIVPRVEREEFLNVGIILYCSKQGFLQAKCQLDKNKLEVFSNSLEYDDLEKYLQTWERICIGGKSAGPIGMLPIASRFRWLTATRSTIVQTSKVHPGFCADAQETLNHLYTTLVL
jgi:Protein of unknown function (DUF3037)